MHTSLHSVSIVIFSNLQLTTDLVFSLSFYTNWSQFMADTFLPIEHNHSLALPSFHYLPSWAGVPLRLIYVAPYYLLL
jgi:hypothetical protein